MLPSVLLLGLVLGARHAFEADHLATVSTLISRQRGWRAMTRHGAIWGIGHAVALLTISLLVLLSPWSLPSGFSRTLELIVGALLVILGLHLAYRLWRDRVHVHAHEHRDGETHLHAHSHRHDSSPHPQSSHDHEHLHADWRTLLIGATHGAAGSAALTVFVAASLESPTIGIVYVVLFGIGSVLGMVALTALIALPLTLASERATSLYAGLQIALSLGAIGIGLMVIVA